MPTDPVTLAAGTVLLAQLGALALAGLLVKSGNLLRNRHGAALPMVKRTE